MENEYVIIQSSIHDLLKVKEDYLNIDAEKSKVLTNAILLLMKYRDSFDKEGQ